MTGPLWVAVGPWDYEGRGRERFWDMTPEQRAAALPAIVEQANAGGLQADAKAFARGWLSEHHRSPRVESTANDTTRIRVPTYPD